MKHLIFKTHRNSKIQLKLIERLKAQGAEVTFEPLDEHLTISDAFSEKEDIDFIQRQLSKGNEAAWFCAKVTVKYDGLEADDYLGCCSYESYDQFTVEYASFYYADMISSCVDSINQQMIKRIADAKQLLKNEGYFIDNLWSVEDVQNRYECDDNTAQTVLGGALSNEWISEQINVTIDDLASDIKLKPKDND